jgi:hypothetical protein
VDGGSNMETARLWGRATQVGVAICERYGQSDELARRLGRSSLDIPAMPDIPIMQWCVPFRRQQAGVALPVIPKAIGAMQLQAITESTRLARIRRILSRER